MAFRQPQQRPQPVRQVSFSRDLESAPPVSPQLNRRLEESQEWILFAPSQAAQSATSRTSQTPRTASHLSDFGSLETGVRSDQVDEEDDNATCQGTSIEDEELDSLDDGLHAFHAPSSPRLDASGGSILPTHDGLGTFPSSYQYADNDEVQEQLWQFERYNPHRRRQRRRSSVQKRLDAMEEEDHIVLDKHEERRLRIEKWRMEQSKAVLEEIERETRRRRRRMSRLSGIESTIAESELSVSREMFTPTVSPQESTVEPPPTAKTEESQENESFWQRITRRVIRDLIGLDENTLSVIFGEELPADLSTTPTQTSPLVPQPPQPSLTSHTDDSWEHRLLQRIARELGILVNQLSEYEGAAFSTYLQSQLDRPLPSSTPSTSAPLPTQSSARPIPTTQQQQRPHRLSDLTASSDALFSPTLAHPAPTPDASLWGIEEEPAPQRHQPQPKEAEYWERDLDVATIFTYLRNRFSSRPASPSPPIPQQQQQSSPPPLPAAWATHSTHPAHSIPQSRSRAALIKAHHPLVSRAAERSAEMRSAAAQSALSAARRREGLSLAFAARRRAKGSSCASQSTKRSLVSSGSRRFWDLGAGGAAGSVGSVVSAVSVGSQGGSGWGEV
ncbi:hypothetical protein M8818_004732 [Zalaria obscura]|uniref:Uncharacterized protein n=1 Tax=Zalaria obscura TaxID=2024903 RepID=A0ACC3SCV9_9PEZI